MIWKTFPYIYNTIQCIAIQYITLHYITLQCIVLYCIFIYIHIHSYTYTYSYKINAKKCCMHLDKILSINFINIYSNFTSINNNFIMTKKAKFKIYKIIFQNCTRIFYINLIMVSRIYKIDQEKTLSRLLLTLNILHHRILKIFFF